MPPDFLNSREDATILWILVAVGLALAKDFRGVAALGLSIGRTLLRSQLRWLFGSTLVYSTLIVWAAQELGLWHPPALKATIYWFLGSAVVLAGDAVTDGARDNGRFLRKVLLRVASTTIVIEFMVNLYAFPLVLEVVGVAVLLWAYAQKRVRVLAAVGLLYLGYFFVRMAADLDGFLTRETAEEFLVGPALTMALLPVLSVWAWISRREQERLHRRFAAH